MPHWEDATGSANDRPQDCGPMPVSVCPSEHVMAEGALLRMLQRHYGWVILEPGLLRRYRRG